MILDVDLASLYEVEPKELNRAVKRNRGRFPIRELTTPPAPKMKRPIGFGPRENKQV